MFPKSINNVRGRLTKSKEHLIEKYTTNSRVHRIENWLVQCGPFQYLNDFDSNFPLHFNNCINGKKH